MTIVRQLSEIVAKLTRISAINEQKAHLEHPEDLVITDDIPGANRALDGILATANKPKEITVKWDGFPALIFGRGINGRFIIVDKHMFDKKDGSGRQIYSPADFVKYDQNRGVDRSGLHSIIATLWEGLEKASLGTKGYFWGDLLFAQPLQPKDGLYTFKPNPNGITYTVQQDSELGRLLDKKKGAIAVHQYLPPQAINTESAQSLNGTIGSLKNNSDIAIVPSAMPVQPKIKLDSSLVSKARSEIKTHGNTVKQMMDQAPQARGGLNSLFISYLTQKIVSGNLNNLVDDFMTYLKTKPMSEAMRKKLLEYFSKNQDGVAGLFSIWIALYNLKNNVVEQLNRTLESSPVKGYLKDGSLSQEGFVSQGLKFINRLGFSRQLLGARKTS